MRLIIAISLLSLSLKYIYRYICQKFPKICHHKYWRIVCRWWKAYATAVSITIKQLYEIVSSNNQLGNADEPFLVRVPYIFLKWILERYAHQWKKYLLSKYMWKKNPFQIFLRKIPLKKWSNLNHIFISFVSIQFSYFIIDYFSFFSKMKYFQYIIY